MARTELFQSVENFRQGKPLKLHHEKRRLSRDDQLIVRALRMAAQFTLRDDLCGEYLRLAEFFEEFEEGETSTHKTSDAQTGCVDSGA